MSETLKELLASPKTKSTKAKFVLATDGVDFEAEEVATGETVACAHKDFADHFGFFLVGGVWLMWLMKFNMSVAVGVGFIG